MLIAALGDVVQLGGVRRSLSVNQLPERHPTRRPATTSASLARGATTIRRNILSHSAPPSPYDAHRHPVNTPKMPGEPKRVQPSRNTDLTRGNAEKDGRGKAEY